MANPKKAPEEKKEAVEFIKPWGRYVRKDIAGFAPDKAKQLKAMKVAVTPGEAPAEEEKEDPKA